MEIVKKKILRELSSAYHTQRQNFEIMNLNFPFEAIWDDHDYGMNDAGLNIPTKKIKRIIFKLLECSRR